MGLLDPEELVRLTVQRFESWEREALRLFFPRAGTILIGAAGSGREMIALHRAGYAVQGFECAHSLVESGQAILRALSCPGQLTWAPAGTVPAMPGQFHAAIMGWSGYMYIPRRSQRVALLRGFRDLLVPGGPLLVSFETRALCERWMYMAEAGFKIVWYSVDGYGWAVGSNPGESAAGCNPAP